MTTDMMISVLRHYTTIDLEDKSVNEIISMYCGLFGEEE